MEQILQPVPIGCHVCSAMVRPTSYDVIRGDEIVTEGQWRCPQCGTYLKRGIFNRRPKNPSNNDQK